MHAANATTRDAPYRELTRRPLPPCGVRWLPDGRRLAIAGRGFEVYDAATGERSHDVSAPCGHRPWTPVSGPDERYLLTSPLRVIDGHGQVVHELVLPASVAAYLADESSGLGRTHSRRRDDGGFDEWDEPFAPYEAASSIAVDPAGRVAVVACGQAFVLAWCLESGVLLRALGHDRAGEPRERVYRTDIAPDGSTVLTRSASGRVRLWDWGAVRELGSCDVCVAEFDSRNVLGAGAVGPAVFLGGTARIAVAEHADVAIYSATGERLGRCRGHGTQHPILAGQPGLPRILDLRASADGRRLLSVGVDASLRLWDTHTCRLLWSDTPHPCCIDFADLSPDGRRVAWAACPGARVYDVA